MTSYHSSKTILPGAEPFYFPGGETGCLLLHGFTSSPEEMFLLGKHLAQAGYTVLGIRLAGHGTQPMDLQRVTWQDWMADIEDGFAFLDSVCKHKVLIGQSMGGMLALTAAAYLKPDAVIALSTPYQNMRFSWFWSNILMDWFRPMVDKKVKQHPKFGIRREADYPAYAVYPTKIYRQTYVLGSAMETALPYLKMPVLLVQSRADGLIPPESLDQINKKIPSHFKQTLWLEGLSHGMTLDPAREILFEKISEFLQNLML